MAKNISIRRSRDILEKEFAKVKARDRRAQDENDPTYTDRYYREMDINKALRDNAGNMGAIRRDKTSRVPSTSSRGYIRENGIDRQDMGLFTKDRAAFNRQVRATEGRNLKQTADWKKKQAAKKKK